MTARVAVSGRAVRTRSAPSAKRSSHRCGACRRVILWLAILRRRRADSGGGRRLRSPVLVALPLGGGSHAAPDLKPSTSEPRTCVRATAKTSMFAPGDVGEDGHAWLCLQ